MKDVEATFLSAIASLQQQGRKIPNFMILQDKGRFRIALRSTQEPVITFGDWAVTTISPREFVIMAKSSQAILDKLEKESKQSKGG